MKKVLVVDDDKDLLVIMKSFLQKNGYDVKVTISCNEGLDIFYSFRPHLVLLDINVGEEDGREMCKKIKAQAEYHHIPVLLISANHEALQLYGDYGANAGVQKPFELPALLSLVESHTV
jgi:DNA-binding response OmpR family regulator